MPTTPIVVSSQKTMRVFILSTIRRTLPKRLRYIWRTAQ